VNNAKPIGLKRDKRSGGGTKIFVSNMKLRNQMGLEKKMKTKLIHLALAAVLMAGFAAPAFAQSTNWELNSDHSTGRLSLSSTADPDATIDAGVARVKGSINLDANSLADSSFNFTIFPADQDPGSVNDDGSVNAREFLSAPRSTIINFRSREVKVTADGNLAVTGDLTVTRLERRVNITYSEAYAGPEYGEPEVHSATREVTFVFQNVASAVAKDESSRKLKLDASAGIKTEDFPGLSEAITDVNWPVVVEDEDQQTATTIGEDYQGAPRTGTPVGINSHQSASQTVGEDYPAPDLAATPVRDNIKIALNLELTRDAAAVAASSAN
jgi:polyisoprenoid-binding protein YceI